MYCPNCGKKIGEKAQFCPFCDAQIETENYKQKKTIAKSFILKFGRFLLDFDTWLWFIFIGIIFIGGVISSLIPSEQTNINPTQGILITFLSCLLILAIVTTVKFVVYLLVDIRDNLKILVEKSKKDN